MYWSTVPDAVVYKRIPHYGPVNEPFDCDRYKI
jgi:hypothetical protein